MGTHWTHFSHYRPYVRACVGYTKNAALSVPCVPVCELAHNWSAYQASVPRRFNIGTNRNDPGTFFCLPVIISALFQPDPLIYNQQSNQAKPLITLSYVPFGRGICYSG